MLREYYSENLGAVWVVDHIRVTGRIPKQWMPGKCHEFDLVNNIKKGACPVGKEFAEEEENV